MKTGFWLILLILFSGASFSQNTPQEKIEPFVDGYIVSKLKDKNIAGAIVLIVKDGEVVLNKGYGYSDVLLRKPVDPNETLFRIGSISKLFVWLAVMQQVEKGKLDLDKDINNYLTTFKIPDTFEVPITMRHLMSHTPGFEDRLLKLFTNDPSEIKTLTEILSKDFPERIRPAGVQASYSNHGTALAAHIVENLSGMSWIDYVESNIINPLGMKNTTFRQPLPFHLASKMSKGYTFSNGLLTEKPFELIPLAPAGAVSTTSTDMIDFLRMLMNQGKLDSTVIISDSTFLEMLKPVITHAPGVNSCLHGFMDVSRKGVKIFGHGGDTFWFHSLVAILPEHNIGIFLSFNSSGGESTYVDFVNDFIDNILPINDSLPPQISLGRDQLEKFAGEYKMNRYPHNDYLKIISLLSRMKIEVVDGKLLITQGQKKEFWVPTDPHTFRKENDSESIKFTFDKSGNVQYAYLSTLSVFAYEKVGLCESQGVHISIFLLVIVLSIVVLIYWPSVYMIRKKYVPMSGAQKPLPAISKITAWVASALFIIFLIGVASTNNSPESVVFSTSTAFKVLLVIPILLIPINLFLLFNMVSLWPLISTRLRSKIFYTLVCFAHIAALWQLYFWNLIGWNY